MNELILKFMWKCKDRIAKTTLGGGNRGLILPNFKTTKLFFFFLLYLFVHLFKTMKFKKKQKRQPKATLIKIVVGGEKMELTNRYSRNRSKNIQPIDFGNGAKAIQREKDNLLN